MKEKKKMSLAMQIFIALVLAIAAGLLMQKIHRRSNRIILYYVWNHFYA